MSAIILSLIQVIYRSKLDFFYASLFYTYKEVNTYIFLTFPLQEIGGGQNYVANKAEYLEQQGWKVYVISGYFNKPGDCPISYLNKYLQFNLPNIEYPPHKMPGFFVKATVDRLLTMINICDADSVIIESHNDRYALWGELLAQKLHARHFVATVNEFYRGQYRYYEDKLDFYDFKLGRGELSCDETIGNRLFEGYKVLTDSDVHPWIIDEDPIRDQYNESVYAIKRTDWNICYIGRGTKPYVQNIISGVGKFASRHKDKKIQFIVVGDACLVHTELINDVKQQNINLHVCDLGNLAPLPRELYNKVDVVIAGSGSARCSVEEGALTLVVDTETKLCNGLLGYDTQSSIYASDQGHVTSIEDSLERVLVKEVYKNMSFSYPPKKGVEFCTKQNFEQMSKASQKFEYYNTCKLLEGRCSVRLFMSFIYNSIKSILRWH